MSERRFCYHCGTSHPKEDMRLIVTRTGKRWRCIKTISGVKKSQAERDAFGKQVTFSNKKPGLDSILPRHSGNSEAV